MTQHTGGPPASAASRTNRPRVAREQVGAAGQRVADTASDQAAQLSREARVQARDLFGQAREQIGEQARATQKNATEGLRSLAGELHDMAEGGDRHGPASDLAEAAADRLGEMADWLGRREPGELVEEVRRLARRRPGAFLFGAAAAGVLAGRLTRGTVDAKRDTGETDTGDGYPPSGPPQRVRATWARLRRRPPRLCRRPRPRHRPYVLRLPVPLRRSFHRHRGPGPFRIPTRPAHGRSRRPDAPARRTSPARPDLTRPASPPPPLGEQTVGEYVDDVHHRGESRSEGPR